MLSILSLFKPPRILFSCHFDELCLWPLNFGNLVDPEKRKRSPTDSAGSPGSKESPSGRMETARPQGLLNVPHLQLPHHTTGKGARHFDTRSLNEENFIASIGVYTTPARLHVHCEIPHPRPPYKLINLKISQSPSPSSNRLKERSLHSSQTDSYRC